MGHGHTRAVDTFTLFVALRPERPVDDAAVDALGAVLRPGDHELRIWREAGRGLLRVATECTADGLDAALELAHALGAETVTACPGSLLEVSALGDEDSLVWRAVP
jgi:hypothetical protein